MASQTPPFDPACTRCPRLAAFLREVRVQYPGYHARPVAPFGTEGARLMVVGLAPGLHGANATGRPFTGDHAGILLYRTLHHYGFASRAESVARGDGLALHDCLITNAVKCLPPANKPMAEEIVRCNDYLRAELATLPAGGVIVALGRIAHEAVLRAFGSPSREYPFAHGAEYRIAERGITLLDSYHCSRYNTQTGRLTEDMFAAVFARARQLLDGVAS